MASEGSPPASIETVEEGRQDLVPEEGANANQDGGRETIPQCLHLSICRILSLFICVMTLVGFGLSVNNVLYGAVSHQKVTSGYLAILAFVGFMIAFYCAFPTTRIKFAARVLASLLLVVGGIYAHFAAISDEENYDVVVAVVCFIGFVGFAVYSCVDVPWYFSPSSIWDTMFRRAAAARDQSLQRIPSTDDQSSDSRQQSSDSHPQSSDSRPDDLESQVSSNAGGIDSEPESTRQARPLSELTSSDSCLYSNPGEADVLLKPSVSEEVCKVKSMASIAQHVPQSAAEKTESAGASSASTSTGAGLKESSSSEQSSSKNVSELEGLNSGELRRRKLLSSIELTTGSCNSSDEDGSTKL